MNESDRCKLLILQFNHQIMEAEQMNEVLYQQNDDVRRRQKRASLEIIGSTGKRYFGTLDQKFADNYKKQIYEIKINEMSIANLVENQTSILENTINVIKKNSAVSKTMNGFE